MKKRLFRRIFSLILVLIAAISLVGCSLTETKTQVTSSSNVYEEAVKNGYTGSLDEWLLSLIQESGYKNVYDLAVENKLFTGTLSEFIASLKGEAGSTSIEETASYSLLSTVSIYATFTEKTTSGGPWGGTTTKDATSAGSGIIYSLDSDGTAYIVTNYHVIYDAKATSPISTNISVFLYGMEYEMYEISATYLGGTMTYDIAVLKIQSDYLSSSSGNAYHAVTINTEVPTAGDSIIAIGNPEAEGLSVTSGIVSVPTESISMTAADDSTKITSRVIRFDAAVNAGNSGGGLYNQNGELIGIVNAKTVDSSIEGMCYAIPISVASSIANNIIKNCNGNTTKTIRKVYLGINVDVASSKAVYDATTKKSSIVQSIKVASVDSDGAAYNTLNVDDVIVGITYNGNYTAVTSLYTVQDVLLQASKNESVSLYILRDGSYKTVSLEFTSDSAVA